MLSHRRSRAENGRVSHQIVGAVAVVLIVIVAGYWTATRADDTTGGKPGDPSVSESAEPTSTDPDTCPKYQRPLVDLGIQAATGRPAHPTISRAQLERLVGQAKSAGADVISTTASFRAIQPAETDAPRYRTIDRVIDAARDAGLEVRLNLLLLPAWAIDESNGSMRQPPRSDAELARWSDLVRQLMLHVRGKVAYVEVWNEPNFDKFWSTGPDPVEFVRLLETTYQVVKRVAPMVQVISGGLVSNDVGFLQKMYDAAEELGLDSMPFDQLGAHPFSGGEAPDHVDPGLVFERDPFGTVDQNYTGFKSMHSVLADNGDKDVPVYITQFGYSTRKLKGFAAVSDPVRATYLPEAYSLAACTGFVTALSWYALHPTPWDPPSWTLLDRRGKPSKTYEALKTWASTSAP